MSRDWDELIKKGKSMPGSKVNPEKVAEKIHEKRLKEDPAKVPYHPGLQSFQQRKDGKIDLRQFNAQENAKNPLVADGNSLMQKNEDLKGFVGDSQEEAKAKEETAKKEKSKYSENKVSTGPTQQEDAYQPFTKEMPYEERLEKTGIDKDKARLILDSLFSDDGYYEEQYTFGKVDYMLRTCKGEPISYMFSQLNKYKQRELGGHYIEEYIYHKNVYLLASVLYRYKERTFVDENGGKNSKLIEETRSFLMELPDFILQKMVDQMIEFEAVIKIVTMEGCEAFFC